VSHETSSAFEIQFATAILIFVQSNRDAWGFHRHGFVSLFKFVDNPAQNLKSFGSTVTAASAGGNFTPKVKRICSLNFHLSFE